MMDKTNSKTVPTPLFEASTAYKRLCGLQCDIKNNNVYGLYVYMRGDGVLLQNKDTDLGVEQYHLVNGDYCNKYYNLLCQIKDYEEFLISEVNDNAKISNLMTKNIDVFNKGYNPNETTSWRRSRCTFRFGKTIDVPLDVFGGYNPIVIQKDSDNLIGVGGCVPVFKTITVCKNQPDYYVYLLKLIDSIHAGAGIYAKRPCIHISLFDNRENADAYKEYMNSESEKFQNHPMYPDIEKQCYSALQRFDKYMGKSR